ncbi:MAG: isochorismatase family protein [Synergistales bacterium]|nr:isochorismatase family protein [Synergistales bacterium]MDY6401739.1 isochorismatase family protein [Synergistales bacterium]MDY6404547.1 isochorismatase family protein [Synergistales bacterium]MDY6411174.1 isochorismatase family protein [Synergistales bacterium]MDY6413628.1 isochorismatase family protein [Synergistales bacterium]
MHKSITARSSFILMIDMQEKLLPAVFNKDEVIKNSVRILTAAHELSIPMIVTEQYPQGIGATISELKNLIPDDTEIMDKVEFSCCASKKFGDVFLNLSFNSGTKDTAILFGVETHICVLATAIDLIEKYNLNVVIAADACGSRDEKNHTLALDAARALGCLVVPAETVVYHMLEKAGTPQFKALLPLLK